MIKLYGLMFLHSLFKISLVRIYKVTKYPLDLYLRRLPKDLPPFIRASCLMMYIFYISYIIHQQIAPIVVGQQKQTIRHFKLSKQLHDCYHHPFGIRSVKYAKQIKCIFIIDQLCDKIRVYSTQKNGKNQTIRPKSDVHIINNNILSIAWSNTQRRLGACLQDYSLCFWDSHDNFTFQKTFSTNLDQLQTLIFYIQYCTTWLTIDQDFNLHSWDIQSQACDNFPSGVHLQRVIDVCELSQLKLVAICSLDKRIVFWDIYRKKVKQIIETGLVSAHQIKFSQFFRTLVSAGFETNITVYTFDRLGECSLLKKLGGHHALVTSITFLLNTPILISADEKCCLRTWDIKKQTCLQSIYCDTQSPFQALINFDAYKFIAVGRRVFWYQFQQKLKSQSHGIEIDSQQPNCILYNQVHSQLIIATKSHIRIIDAITGKTNQILAGFMGDIGNQIMGLSLGFRQRSFILVDTTGNVTQRRYQDGKEILSLPSHKSDVVGLEIDQKHSLIVTASQDSTVRIFVIYQKYQIKICGLNSNDQFIQLRKVSKAHYDSQITLMALSIYHNKIVTASSSSFVIV